MALTTGLFVIGKMPKNSIFYGTASLIRDLGLEMPAEEKARSGLMLAGVGSKLRGILCKVSASTLS